ncbi:MAG: hypothetical protein ACI9MR_002723 [Myxococcota bacterium]|jgi:hypothetical protein
MKPWFTNGSVSVFVGLSLAACGTTPTTPQPAAPIQVLATKPALPDTLPSDAEPDETSVTATDPTDGDLEAEAEAPPALACIPRDLSAQKPAIKPRRASAKHFEGGCFATTIDGRQAVFVLSYSDRFADHGMQESTRVEWFGHGEPPEVDLDCLVDDCGRRRIAAMKRAIKRARLITCYETDEAVVDAKAHPLSESEDTLWITPVGQPIRPFHTLAMSEHDGGDHESLETFFQHPDGGPLFALIHNADTGLSEDRVETFDAVALGFCDGE